MAKALKAYERRAVESMLEPEPPYSPRAWKNILADTREIVKRGEPVGFPNMCLLFASIIRRLARQIDGRPAPKSGKGRRQKGHDYERLVANRLSNYFPDAKRGLQSRGAADAVSDVINTPFWVECKAGNSHSLPAICRQIERDQQKAEDCRPWMIWLKRADCPELVCMRPELFISIIDRLDTLPGGIENVRWGDE